MDYERKEDRNWKLVPAKFSDIWYPLPTTRIIYNIIKVTRSPRIFRVEWR